MSDTLLDIETVTLGTSLDQLFDLGLFSVRARNALSNCGCSDVKSILDIDIKHFRRRHRNVGPKTAREVADFQGRYSFLNRTVNKNGEYQYVTVLGIEYVRKDFPYLSDKEFDFVCSYWRENGKLPASLVALRFIENSKDRNLRMKRMYVGLGFDKQYSIEELMAEFELTKPTVRHIVYKPGLLPADLRLRQSLMKMLPDAPFVCDAHYFEPIMQKEHWPYDAASFMALLSIMMRGVEFIQLSEKTSSYLVRNSLSFDNAIQRGAHNIDVAFQKNFAKASKQSLRKLTKLQYDSEDFCQTLPIFEEYISVKYGTTVDDSCDTENLLPLVSGLKFQLEGIKRHKTGLQSHDNSEPSKAFLKKRLEKIENMITSVNELHTTLQDYKVVACE